MNFYRFQVTSYEWDNFEATDGPSYAKSHYTFWKKFGKGINYYNFSQNIF
jgi:hypothetical protein